ncbi:MAG: hypothetical protein WKF87_00415 [Chryseolinea sp.]
MSLEIFYIIFEISNFLAIVIVLMAFIPFKGRNFESRIIGVASLIMVATYLILISFTFHGKEVNIPQSVAVVLIVITLALLYHISLQRRYSHFFFISTAVFFIFSVCNLFFWQKDENNSYTDAIGSFLLIIYGIMYLYRLLVDLPVQQLHTVPMFWFNAAILIYRAGALFLFLFTHYLVKVLNNDLLIYWTFHNILAIVHQIVITIGLWQDLRNTKLRSLSPSVP